MRYKDPLFFTDPWLKDSWSPNNTIDPAKLTRGSTKKVLWVCELGHEYCSSICSRTRTKSRGCPYCSGNKVLVGFNDLASTHPEISCELDEKKSGITAQELSKGSKKKCWWTCPKGHSYVSQVKSRVSGRGCAVCHGLQVQIGFNDLNTTHPSLSKELDEELSGVSSKELTYASGRKVFWRCSENPSHVWEASVASRSWGRGCSQCSKIGTSLREEQLHDFVKESVSFSVKKNAEVPVTYRGISKYKVDLLIQDKVIVEYDGSIWHSMEDSYKRDERKTKRLLEEGYYVLRIREKLGNKYDLHHLNIDHPNLTQISCESPYYHKDPNYSWLDTHSEQILSFIHKHTVDIEDPV